MSKYRIAWRNLSTGQSGFSPSTFDEATARELCAELNSEYADFEHRVEPEESVMLVKAGVTPAPRPHQPVRVAPTKQIEDSYEMPFGEHRGVPIGQIPATYLDWLDGQAWLPQRYPEISDYITRSQASINQDLRRGER